MKRNENKIVTKDISIVTGYNEEMQQPITENVNKTMDRLCVDMHIGGQGTNGHGIKNTVVVKVKECSSDGFIGDTVKNYVYPEIKECKDMKFLMAFAKIEAILEELFVGEEL